MRLNGYDYLEGIGMSALHMTMKRIVNTSMLLLLSTSLSGCATTVGQEFRNIMADIDADCRDRKLGPYLDGNHRYKHGELNSSSCDILLIKPADPLATEEGRFAYSIKLPAPHDKLKTEYSQMMTAEGYFKQLCEKDAGEWIFKTVEGVEGVFQGRQNYPPSQVGDSLLVFQLREVADAEVLNRNMEGSLVQPYHGRYNYLERPIDLNETGKPYIRFLRGAEVQGHPKAGTQKNRMPIEVPYIVNSEQADTLKSRYGYTWRQVDDKDMLESGIVGSETIIFDRTTNEVLAFRRLFFRYWPRPDSRYTRLVNHEFCKPGFTNGFRPFINKVLVPINPAE